MPPCAERGELSQVAAESVDACVGDAESGLGQREVGREGEVAVVQMTDAGDGAHDGDALAGRGWGAGGEGKGEQGEEGEDEDGERAGRHGGGRVGAWCGCWGRVRVGGGSERVG